MKILIVEDEPPCGEIMVRTLTREQYVVEQAADYAAALDKTPHTTTTASCWTSCCPAAATCGCSKS